MTCQRLWGPTFLAMHHDFWTGAYQAIDDGENFRGRVGAEPLRPSSLY
jgi:hypothetical protein